MAEHENRQHALLGASTSERWLNCTPSARLEEKYGIKKTSVYAEEGTTAHELAELNLRYQLEMIDTDKFYDELAQIMAKDSYNDEMPDMVQIYTDYCIEQFEQAKTITLDALILIEQKINITDYIPEGFGTDDCIVIADGIMEVIDLKYGKGIAVKAERNKQLMIYGLGAYARFSLMYDITEVKLTIVQPRLDSISTWSVPIDELINWAETDLTQRAKLAFDGDGDLLPGSWCKFCSIRTTCPSLAESNLKLAKYEFAPPALLTDEDIATILAQSKLLAEWASSIHEYALSEAIKGKQWPGYKLVEGVARRKWVSEDAAASKIYATFPGCEEEDIYNLKLKGITELEKKFGKKDFAEKLKDVVIKPQGAPTLVPEADKRTAIGIEQAKADFK